MNGTLRMCAILFAASLALAGCGGGGGGGATAGGAAAGGGGGTAAQVVSLTGVVATGTQVPSTGAPVGAIPVGITPAGQQPTVRPGTIVLAVDVYGNTKSAVADQQGRFKLDLDAGMAYAILFVDPQAILQNGDPVIGSLVSAANQTQAAAVTANSNTDLGRVIINPAKKKAVSENEAANQLQGAQVVAAPAGMDKNGDGVITKQEADTYKVSQVQKQVQQGGQAKITSVSALDFLPKPGTWWTDISTWTDPTGQASGKDVAIAVASAYRTTGPNGQPIVAVKSSFVDYYSSYVDPYTNMSGFYTPYGQVGPDYSALQPSTPPAQYNPFFPWAWAWLDVVDQYSWWELGGVGDPYAKWQRFAPANLTVGKQTSLTIGPYDWWTMYDMYGNPTVMMTGTDQITYLIQPAQKNGQPYLFTDASGKQHLVYRVHVHGVTTVTPTAQCDPYVIGMPCQQQTFPPFDRYSYVITGWGIQVDVTDAPTLPVDQALARVQFGRISKDPYGNFVSATLENSLAADPYGWSMPNKQMLDAWIAYAWNNRDVLGVFDPKAMQGATQVGGFFSVQSDAYGNPSVTPLPYDPVTWMPKPLTAGGNVNVSVTVDYAAPNGESFSLEWRVWDPNTGQPQTIGTPVAAQGAGATTGNATATATLTATLTVPTIAQLPAGVVYTDPVTNIQQGWVDLWLVMKDNTGAVVQEQPITNYLVQQ